MWAGGSRAGDADFCGILSRKLSDRKAQGHRFLLQLGLRNSFLSGETYVPNSVNSAF